MAITKSYFYDLISVRLELSDEIRQNILTNFPPPKLPTSEEFFNLDNESAGNTVNIRVLLNEYSVQLTKTNKQYLKITFSNNFGPIQAKMWDNDGNLEAAIPLLDEFSVFDVEGVVDEFRGYKSITVQRLVPCQEQVNPFSLLAYTQQDLEELTVELFSYLYELKPPYKDISLAAMTQFWDQFRLRPAARGHHHNYLGGLLKHTVGLMRIAHYILKQEKNHFQATIRLIHTVEKEYKRELWEAIQAEDVITKQFVWKDTIDHLYGMLTGMMQYKDQIPNYDALITSILFHDIGKLLEYDHAGKKYDEFNYLFPTASVDSLLGRKQTGIIMDELGVLIGHIPYGLLMLTKVIETENIQISLEAIHLMAHCILCHHGLPEWGSAVREPQNIEGYLIHIVDFLDSRYEKTEIVK